MKLSILPIMLLLGLTSLKAVVAQSGDSTALLPLYQYLNVEGKANDWHFTIEDNPRHTSFHKYLIDVIIANKKIQSFSEFKRYLQENLPGITVSMGRKGIIAITENSLINDSNYVLNKTTSCDYDGLNYNFVDYLSPLLNGSLRRATNHMRNGPLRFPPGVCLSIHTKEQALRSILTTYLPLSDVSVILWNAWTDDSSGKEVTYFQSAGEEI